jgi:hypothetical protein
MGQNGLLTNESEGMLMLPIYLRLIPHCQIKQRATENSLRFITVYMDNQW